MTTSEPINVPDPPDADPPITSGTELETGIFNLVVTLVQYHRSVGLAPDEARARVADHLEHLAATLRTL